MATSKQEKQRRQTRIAIGIFVAVGTIVLAAVVARVMLSSGEKCPRCGQHYVIIDNSTTLTQKEKDAILFPKGFLSVVWEKYASVGDQINILGLSKETLDARIISSIDRVKSPSEANEAIESPGLIELSYTRAVEELNTSLDSLGDADIAESRIFETLQDVSPKIQNHTDAYGSDQGSYRYSVTLYSDLLQNSSTFSFYTEPKLAYEDWQRQARSSAGRAVFGRDVVLDVRRINRGDPVAGENVYAFWLNYLGGTGAEFKLQ